MSKNSDLQILSIIANVSVSLMLAVGGIWALQGGGDFGCRAIKSIFSGDLAKILVLVFGGIELLSGIFILLQLFIGDRIGTFSKILKLIVVIVWIAAIVVSDFFGSKGVNFGVYANSEGTGEALAYHESTVEPEDPTDGGMVYEYQINGTAWCLKNTTEFNKPGIYSITVVFLK